MLNLICFYPVQAFHLADPKLLQKNLERKGKMETVSLTKLYFPARMHFTPVVQILCLVELIAGAVHCIPVKVQ